MSARLAAGMIVSALIRRIEASGGTGMILSKGDAISGAMLVVLTDRGRTSAILERALDAHGRYHWTPTGPDDPDAPGTLADYIGRRRRFDPDLWVVELDGPDARRIVDEVAGDG